MANGVIIPPNDVPEWVVVSSENWVKMEKQGNIVTLWINGWATIANISIPSEYRPPSTAYFVAESQNGFVRMTVNSDGTVSSSETKLMGTFTWMT